MLSISLNVFLPFAACAANSNDIVLKEAEVGSSSDWGMVLLPASDWGMGSLQLGEDVEKGEHSFIAGRSANLYSHCGNQYGGFSEN